MSNFLPKTKPVAAAEKYDFMSVGEWQKQYAEPVQKGKAEAEPDYFITPIKNTYFGCLTH